MKKILVLCVLFIFLIASTAFAFKPSDDWTWRDSTDMQSIYSFNAPPELVSVDKDKQYVELTGYVLSVFPYDDNISHYQAKVRVGIKIIEKQMWIAYLQQVAYNKDNKQVKIKINPEMDNWHSVLHNTAEEAYGLAVFQAFKEYLEKGYYKSETKKTK